MSKLISLLIVCRESVKCIIRYNFNIHSIDSHLDIRCFSTCSFELDSSSYPTLPYPTTLRAPVFFVNNTSTRPENESFRRGKSWLKSPQKSLRLSVVGAGFLVDTTDSRDVYLKQAKYRVEKKILFPLLLQHVIRFIKTRFSFVDAIA